MNGIFFGETTAGAVAAGIVPAGKHFLLNEQETNRSTQYSGASISYSVDIDDKTLHETYLWPFYDGKNTFLDYGSTFANWKQLSKQDWVVSCAA